MISAAGAEEEEEIVKALHRITKVLEEELEVVVEVVAGEGYQVAQMDG